MSIPSYFSRYPTIALSRSSDGVLTVQLHSNGGEVAYDSQHHEDWCGAFHDIGIDRDNRVVIITGTGAAFIDKFAWSYRARTASDWDLKAAEARRMLRSLLDIEVPVIAAVNGPATIHAEIVLLSDITLATTHAVFQDRAHVSNRIVPGDGAHTLWLELLGMNRGRYFLLTEQRIDAAEALRLGVVNEVLAPEQLMPRARAHAKWLAGWPTLTLRHTRAVLTQRLKRLLDEGVPLGLALEGLSLLDLAANAPKGEEPR